MPADSLATELEVRAPLNELFDPSYRSQEAVELPTNFAKGLQGSIYDVGKITSLPDFSTLTPFETALFYEIRWKTTREDEEDRRLLKNWRGFTFEGFIYIDKTENWSFELFSDDGSTLFIDNAKVIDNDGTHGDVTKEGSVQLS